MSYILMEESAFRRLMERIIKEENAEIRYDFTDADYWMSGKEASEYLRASKALMNTYRRENTLCYCKISETYHYKRADVYRLKVRMDRELVESGTILGECRVIGGEKQAFKAFDENKEN